MFCNCVWFSNLIFFTFCESGMLSSLPYALANVHVLGMDNLIICTVPKLNLHTEFLFHLL